MRRVLLTVCLAACAALAIAVPAHAAFVPGEVVVRFEPDAGQRSVAAALDAVDARGAERLPLPDVRVLRLPAGERVADAVARLNASDGVAWAEPNYLVEAARIPDDPQFPTLWGLQNPGGTFGGQPAVAGIDIAAATAWDTITDARPAAVGVADTGIMRDHPDLAANVDPALSRDFTQENGEGDPFVDGNSHGSHVAGTIGAVGDNGVGVTGVAWQARMGALKVLTASGGGTSASVAAGFAWAGAHGLPVLNASLGGPEYSQLIRDAIESAPDTLFVVSAGNDARDDDVTPSYPCSYPAANLLCVAAIAPDGSLASFSNYGKVSVDVGAPGVAINSTVPEQDLPYREAFAEPLAGRWATGGGPGAWTREDVPGDPRVVPGDGAGSYGPGLDQTLTTADPIAIGGRRGCVLIVGWESTVPPENATLSVETSTDGFSFTRVDTLEAVKSYTQRAFDLDDPAEPLWVRLRFVTAPSLPEPAGPAPYVNRVAVRCLTGGATYDLKNGTSMASPQVAGIAALVRARQPGLTAPQARQAIMESTRPLASLAGRTVTGGLVDLPGALARADAIAAGGGGGGGGGGTPQPPASVPESGPANPGGPVTPDTPATSGAPAGARFALAVSRRQHALRRGVAVTFTPLRDGTVHVSGRLRRGAKRVGLPALSRPVTAGEQATLRLKPGPRGRALVRNARKRGKAVRARLVVTFVGDDGARETARRTVRVV